MSPITSSSWFVSSPSGLVTWIDTFCKVRSLVIEMTVLPQSAAGTGFVTLFYLLGVPLIAFEGGFRMFGFALLALWMVIGMVCWMLGFGALLLSRLGQDDQPNAVHTGAMPVSPVYPAPNPQTM